MSDLDEIVLHALYSARKALIDAADRVPPQRRRLCIHALDLIGEAIARLNGASKHHKRR